MPKNLKVGISAPAWFMRETLDDYYDFIYCPYEQGAGMEYFIGLARDAGVPFGMHINGMPWGDSADQSIRHLHNYLEEYGGGKNLQVDRLGRIRMASLPQDPTIPEQAKSPTPCLEMQLTLSRNATMVQDYVARNNRICLRALDWYREQFPDVVLFASMSSEYGQNKAANDEYCDYSTWSKQEFRDWLSGAGLYAGHGQFASLAAFNAAFAGAPGFPWPSWAAVQPPTAVNWTGGTAGGNWWNLWHQFRVAQVNNIVQAQIDWSRGAGWSPDRLFGHQIPFSPGSTSEEELKYASPWTTTFVTGGSDGVTTYGANAGNGAIFGALRADNKNWGIFEYNPQAADVAGNLNALEATWSGGAHVICPYFWSGHPGYQIRGTVFESALQQFVRNHAQQRYAGQAAYEAAPSSKDVIWTMSTSNDVQQITGVSGPVFTNGNFSGTAVDPGATVSLALDTTRHWLVSDAYYAASFRLGVSNAATGGGRILWQDTNNQTWSVPFTPRPGTNVYHLNLAENAGWRERSIKSIRFSPGAEPGTGFMLDWFRLEADHCWHFDDPGEVYGLNQLTNAVVTNGWLRAVSGPDGYAYLSTDSQSVTGQAKRAFVRSEFFKKARVRLWASTAGNAQLYWWTRNGGPYFQSFPVRAGTNTYEMDLSQNTNWCGNITRLRISPVKTAGVRCAVDYVSFAPVLLSPRAANFDLIVNSDQPVFTWDEAIEPDHAGLAYAVQLASDFGFTNVVFATNGIAGTNCTYAGTTALDGLYWWRVRASDTAGDQSMWTVPMPMFVRTWHFVETNDVWALSNIGSVTTTNGWWQGVTTGSNGWIEFNSGANKNQGLDADLYKYFCVRAKVAGGTNTSSAQFEFFPRDGTNGIAVPIALPGDGQWHDVVVDLSGEPAWSGFVGSIRLLPTDQMGAGVGLAAAKFLPVTLPPTNPPVLAAVPDIVIGAGKTLTVSNTVAETVGRSRPLMFRLLRSPAGGVIDASNGVFTWRPGIAQGGSTNEIEVEVAAGAAAGNKAKRSFRVVVTNAAQPWIGSWARGAGGFQFWVNGDVGPDYVVQASTNLADWLTLCVTNPAALPFAWGETNGRGEGAQFYRVKLAP